MRPIAVGDCLRRIAAKWLVRSPAGREAASSLLPRQIAFCKGGPCETLGMAVQSLVDGLPGDGDWVLLQIDLQNAFNSVERGAVTAAVSDLFPAAVPWVSQTMQAAPLLCGQEVLWSRKGVQQGDPLGPLLFALAIHDVVATAPGDHMLHRWYLHDGVVVTKAGEAEAGAPSGAACRAAPPSPGVSLSCRRRLSGCVRG